VTSTTRAKPTATADVRSRPGDIGSQSIIITPPGRFPLPSFAQIWESREIFISFGRRDITLRYRQTVLGVVWVVLQPLLSAGIFTVIFGKVARLPTGGVPYFAFTLSGMVAWNMVSGVISRGSGSLVSNSSLVSKVFFPRIIVPLSTICSVLLDFSVAMCLMSVLLVVYRINPGWPIALIPIWVISALMLGCGIGTACSALMVRFRDIQYIVPVTVGLLLYATPIAYSVNAIPQRYRAFFDVNPFAWLLQDFHWSLVGSAHPPIWQMAGSVGMGIVVFFVGAIIFEKMERSIADYI
jgi:lipopolysaccharide transport system permease protein